MGENTSLNLDDRIQHVSNGTTPAFPFKENTGHSSALICLTKVMIGVTDVLGKLLVVFIV